MNGFLSVNESKVKVILRFFVDYFQRKKCVLCGGERWGCVYVWVCRVGVWGVAVCGCGCVSDFL